MKKEKAKLTIKTGNQAGKVFPLYEGDKKEIGRDNKCDIKLIDRGASRRHSLIEWQNECFYLRDLGSTNGTYVNNKIIISSKRLKDGDIIKIGHTKIIFNIIKESRTLTNFIEEEDNILFNSNNTIMERVNLKDSLSLSHYIFTKTQTKEKVEKEPHEKRLEHFLYTIYEVSNIVNKEHDLKKLTDVIIDKVMEVFKPDRGFIVLWEKDNDYFDIIASKILKGDINARLSSTILKKTVHEGISILSANAMLDDRFGGELSIVSQHIKSVMSVPLESSNNILGAIYVDSLDIKNKFNKDHLDLLTAIGKQAGIAIERTQLFEHYLEKERIKESLNIAQEIQKSLLPTEAPENFEYDLVGWNLTCDETGGDYYDFFNLDKNKIGIAIGDVSGHGVGAALLMATARAFLKALSLKSKGNIVNIMNELNCLLEKDMEDDKFMTLFYGELDIKRLELTYINAGHEPPLLYRRKKDEFEDLESTGIPLGMDEDFEYDEYNKIKISEGDILVFLTDGITESMDPEGEQFGRKRLAQIIRKSRDKSSHQIIRDCYEALCKFCKDVKQRDDITIVVVKFEKRNSNNELPRFKKEFTRKIKI